jgi:hypothetical protein
VASAVNYHACTHFSSSSASNTRFSASASPFFSFNFPRSISVLCCYRIARARVRSCASGGHPPTYIYTKFLDGESHNFIPEDPTGIPRP